MELQIQVEKPSNIVRKLTVKVPANVVANKVEKQLVAVQRTAKLKGFRPGHAPLSVVKQYYGEDVRHQVYHDLIDESFQVAIREQKLMTVGRPVIDAPEHQLGQGEHDHAVKDGQDLVYTATVEVIPEVEVKGYTGVALTKGKSEVTDSDVETVIEKLRDSHAELIPASGGIVGADGKTSSRPAVKGDFVDMAFSGGLVTPNGIDERPDMKGSRVHEIGSDALIPGFEDHLIGMRAGETKTFRIHFPKEYGEASLQGSEAEFTVTVQELKEKKLPVLDDEFSKQIGYENVADFRKKAKEHLVAEKNREVEEKLKSDLVQALIAKHEFEVPKALVESQTRSLAQEWAERLKQQGVDDKTSQNAILGELDQLKKRAEGQVRASLILEAIAKKESIDVTDAEVDGEISNSALSMRVELEKVREFYAKNPGRREDLLFRMRQDKTLRFLLDKAKIKSS